MLKYIIKRVILAGITIFAVATITFFLMNLVPGGPFEAEKAVSEQAKEALNEKYGLDKPLGVQYQNYIKNALRFDLGLSIKQRGRTVNEIIASKFPVSARIGIIAICTAIIVGVPLGSIAAYKRGSFIDSFVNFFSTLGIALPSFVICTIMLKIFSMGLGILPSYGLETPKHYIMPVIALSFYPSAYVARLMRSSMLDVMGQDYMRTAKSKGVSNFKAIFKHALRNAILPVVTYIGPMSAYTLVGSFVVEKIFTIPGLGSEFVSSITNRDYTIIMGTTIFLATILILMNMVVDIVYKLIDPRIQLD